ncbi:MAG: hypothetical protein U9N81_12960 [Bacillota bacterium]|nr:hypothetical protein [Bacillota bacterium]
MKHIISLILAITMTCSLLTYDVSAANNSVSITIPSFQVTVNDRTVDSTQLQYPLIVYNDITYFPLTWKWCRELGLASSYTNEDGLYIANYTSESQDTLDDGSYQAAGTQYTAVIPIYPVYINGQQIDNNKEEYPLLNFRNITYFPLTWRFVADEFGWDESWSNTSGYKLYTHGSAAEYPPGTHYYSESFFPLENYRDYLITEKVREERSINTQPSEHGTYSDKYEGRTYSYYKLDYATDTLTQTASEETADTPYNSGAVSGENVDDLFCGNSSILCFKDSPLLDLTEDAGTGNAIDRVYATKHSINGMTVYMTFVLFTQDNRSIPAPYTPRKYYAFIDKGDGVLHQVDSWPTDQILSAVYPCGTDGVYLCSTGRIFGSTRYNNGRGWICIVNADFSVTTLNGRWEDWNSLDAVGMDDAGNLYLLNTWFPDYDLANRTQGTVSPINDGYFRLSLDGKLTKIYPFVKADQIFVTPSGEIYIDADWIDPILHLQTGTWIKPD